MHNREALYDGSQMGGPDAMFSAEPAEFKSMVEAIREVSMGLGENRYGSTKSEEGSRNLRRSLYVGVDLPAGHILDEDDIVSLRPFCGLPPRELANLVGRDLQYLFMREHHWAGLFLIGRKSLRNKSLRVFEREWLYEYC